MSKQSLPRLPVVIRYADPDTLFNINKEPNSLLKMFADAPRPSFIDNTSASILWDKTTGKSIISPQVNRSTDAPGTGRYSHYGHSERNGMMGMLNLFMPEGERNGEIERPQHYEGRYGYGDSLRAVTDRAADYKKYLESRNAAVGTWSDRSPCESPKGTKEGCDFFVPNIYPTGSFYNYISPYNTKDSAVVEQSYDKMRAAYLKTPWMQQPQPSTLQQPQQPQVGSTPSFVPRGDLSSFASSVYNPFSSSSSSSSSTAPHNTQSSWGIHENNQPPVSTSFSSSTSSFPSVFSSSSYRPRNFSGSVPYPQGPNPGPPRPIFPYPNISMNSRLSNTNRSRSRSRSRSPERKEQFARPPSIQGSVQSLATLAPAPLAPLTLQQRASIAERQRLALVKKGDKSWRS